MKEALLRILLGAVSGAGVYASFQPLGLWWAGIIGIVGLYVALSPWAPTEADSPAPRRPIPIGVGMAVAWMHTMTAYLLLLPWIGELVGTFPYVALAFTLSLWSLLLGWWGSRVAVWRYGFALFPFLFLLIEFARSMWPFGGFAWVRVAWGQVGGPFETLARLGGPALVSFAVVCIACGFVGLFHSRRHVKSNVAAMAMISVPAVLCTSVTGQEGHEPAFQDTVKVAAIQGNVPRLGLDFNAQRRAVLSNHVKQTHAVVTHNPDLDLVIWPENSSDVNPLTDSAARGLIDGAVTAAGVPIVVGTITKDSVGDRNTMQVFAPGGEVGEHHHKKFLQPFGETMPFRDVLRHVSEYVDLAGDFKPGTGNGVVHANGIALGIATCYEVQYDAAYREAVKAGAQLLATPTNNATFGFSDMTYQQLAMSRMRAVETDRAVVVPATSGVSAIIAPDGTVAQRTEVFTAASLVEDLPLRDGLTPAVRWGTWLEWLLAGIGVGVALCAMFPSLRRRCAWRRPVDSTAAQHSSAPLTAAASE
ncbi:apolipoprotein N-acyltransferase [Corynebacterium incognita]|uniref:Apolipoprotein N-acyltransferase n=1 Tax=Corynebacterium incognita TaxID=2754725 RepID=A0A7G7CPN3_9CORY|nr:apolipoprotein N-acyltransferase [Corynebacterium incognita]QNE89549.1 apolipoprotein N-acyltransferase [Corynebacterium incognita]